MKHLDSLSRCRMFKATIKSLLSRKLRLVLSALAVVLGVMFVSGSFVLTDTLQRSFTDLFSSALRQRGRLGVAEGGEGQAARTADAAGDRRREVGAGGGVGRR